MGWVYGVGLSVEDVGLRGSGFAAEGDVEEHRLEAHQAREHHRHRPPLLPTLDSSHSIRPTGNPGAKR